MSTNDSRARRLNPKPIVPSTLRQVKVDRIRTGAAQRPLREARVNRLVAEFDVDKIGYPVLNYRDGVYYVVDGQHRIEAYRRWSLPPHGSLLCQVYEGLTERQEADLFDRVNDVLPVSVYDRFRARLHAGRETETIVDKIVAGEGLRIENDRAAPGSVCCVGTLVKVYETGGSLILQKTLRTVAGAFGDAGLLAPVIDGAARALAHYAERLDEGTLMNALKNLRGGHGGLLNYAEVTRKKTGKSHGECVAAAIVDAYNGATKKKVASWWKREAVEEEEAP